MHRRRPVKLSIAYVIIFILSHLNIINNITTVAAFPASTKRHYPAPHLHSTTTTMLTRRTPLEVQLEIKDPVDPTAFVQAKAILDELKSSPVTSAAHDSSLSQTTACSPDALLSIAKRLGDIPSDDNDTPATYIVSPSRCREAFDSLSESEKKSLLNIHHRVQVFAEAQRRSVVDMEVDIPGGKAGQTVSPCRGALLFIISSNIAYVSSAVIIRVHKWCLF